MHIKSKLRYEVLDRYWKAGNDIRKADRPVAVYTMAKVGSSSIYHTIKQQTRLKVYHVHSLDQAKIIAAVDNAKSRGIIPRSREVGGLIYTNRVQSKKPLRLISCVRDPIARNISAFLMRSNSILVCNTRIGLEI